MLTRPPLARPLLATLLVMAALWADLRPPALVDHPFLTVDVTAGTEVDAGMVTSRPVVRGTFAQVQLPATVHRDLAAGDPLSLGDAPEETGVEVPDGWLTLELAVPAGAEPGDAVVVVVAQPEDKSLMITGLVTEVGIDDGFGSEVAACAFDPEEAATVAVAVSEQRASVLVGG